MLMKRSNNSDGRCDRWRRHPLNFLGSWQQLLIVRDTIVLSFLSYVMLKDSTQIAKRLMMVLGPFPIDMSRVFESFPITDHFL